MQRAWVTSLRLIVLLPLVEGVASLSIPVTIADEEVLPNDFSITATYTNPGSGLGHRWETRISADGTALQLYHDPDNREKLGEVEVRRSFKLTHRDLVSLFEMIKGEDFWGLPKNLAHSDEDGPFLGLSVTMGKKTHEVITLGGQDMPGQEERFNKVFEQVCRFAPNPYEAETDEPEVKPAPVAPRKPLPR